MKLAKIMFFCTFWVFTVLGESVENGKIIESKKVTVKEFVMNYKVYSDSIWVEVSYPTSGWVAVGFNPSKIMRGANIIIGSSKENDSRVVDNYGTGLFRHKPDTSIGGINNISNGRCGEKDGVTTISFKIPLDSGDEKDVVLKKGDKVKVIFAAGRKDNLRSKHNKTGKIEIIL